MSATLRYSPITAERSPSRKPVARGASRMVAKEPLAARPQADFSGDFAVFRNLAAKQVDIRRNKVRRICYAVRNKRAIRAPCRAKRNADIKAHVALAETAYHAFGDSRCAGIFIYHGYGSSCGWSGRQYGE